MSEVKETITKQSIQLAETLYKIHCYVESWNKPHLRMRFATFQQLAPDEKCYWYGLAYGLLSRFNISELPKETIAELFEWPSPGDLWEIVNAKV